MTFTCFPSRLFALSSEGLRPETKDLLASSSKKKAKGGSKAEEEPKTEAQHVAIGLRFKRYIFDPHKKMSQSWPAQSVGGGVWGLGEDDDYLLAPLL